MELRCTYHSEELTSPTLKHGIGPQTAHFSVPPCHSTNVMGRPESKLQIEASVHLPFRDLWSDRSLRPALPCVFESVLTMLMHHRVGFELEIGTSPLYQIWMNYVETNDLTSLIMK